MRSPQILFLIFYFNVILIYASSIRNEKSRSKRDCGCNEFLTQQRDQCKCAPGISPQSMSCSCPALQKLAQCGCDPNSHQCPSICIRSCMEECVRIMPSDACKVACDSACSVPCGQNYMQQQIPPNGMNPHLRSSSLQQLETGPHSFNSYADSSINAISQIPANSQPTFSFNAFPTSSKSFQSSLPISFPNPSLDQFYPFDPMQPPQFRQQQCLNNCWNYCQNSCQPSYDNDCNSGCNKGCNNYCPYQPRPAPIIEPCTPQCLQECGQQCPINLPSYVCQNRCNELCYGNCPMPPQPFPTMSPYPPYPPQPFPTMPPFPPYPPYPPQPDPCSPNCDPSCPSCDGNFPCSPCQRNCQLNCKMNSPNRYNSRPSSPQVVEVVLRANTILSPNCNNLCQGSCNQQCTPSLSQNQCGPACQTLCHQNCPQREPKIPCQKTEQIQCLCPQEYEPCENGTMCCLKSVR